MAIFFFGGKGRIWPRNRFNLSVCVGSAEKGKGGERGASKLSLSLSLKVL